MFLNELFGLIIKITFLQALVYALIFILNKKRNISFILLGLFLITGVGPHLGQILKQLFPNLNYFPANFLFLSPVLFYLYSRSVLGVLTQKSYLHLLPGCIELVFNLVLFVYPNELGSLFYDKVNNPFLLILYVYIIPVYCIFYSVKSILLINQYKTTIPMLYSMHELSRLSWIKITCYILIIANALEAINSLLVIEATYATYAYLFSTILSGFVFYWVSIYGLNQKNLLLGIEDENTTSTTIENPTVAILAPSNQKNIQPEYYQEKYNKIVCFVTETKIYKDKELNLFTIANLLQMPYREVSNVINKFANKNFNLFLNEFRVEEAKHLISEDSSDKFNLTWIAEEVGFNSRSTFFAAFKTIAGLTPAEYKKSQRTL